jgi:capsular exopolysaccharide synthesis family protein
VVEAFRTLDAAMNIALSSSQPCPIWMAISAVSGEGKSTVTARWAAGLAASGKRVLLVDGDMRNPSLHHEIMETCDPGLVALLAGEQNVAPVTTSHPNLHFLGVGSLTPNPAELLHSHCLPEWLTFCRERFDVVIIDSPPLLPVADGLLLGAHVDGLVLVVREGVTARADIHALINKLGALRDKLVGIVYNGVRQGHSDYRYYSASTANDAADKHSA